MTEAKHTPEPWEAQTDLDGDTYIQTASPMPLAIDRPGLRMVRLCKPLIAKIFPHYGCAAFSGEANARRIVACVNACAGVDTETLVAMANGEMNGSEIWELAKVKQQNAALAMAFEGVDPLFLRPGFVLSKVQEVDALHLLIARERQQRDELLAIVKRIAPHLSGSWQQEIKAAIAKAGEA